MMTITGQLTLEIFLHSVVSFSPNAIFKIKPKEGIIDFVALNDIEKDTEITFNYYHSNPKDKSPLWFEV